jgi:hypothetical protein
MQKACFTNTFTEPHNTTTSKVGSGVYEKPKNTQIFERYQMKQNHYCTDVLYKNSVFEME